MPARSAALPSGPSPAGPHRDALDAAHCELGLRSDEIAQALGANASALHRRRAGDVRPLPVLRHRLAALAELTAAVRELRRRPGTLTAAVTAAALVEPLAEPLVTRLVEPPPPTAPEPGRPESEGARIGRSGRPAGARA